MRHADYEVYTIRRGDRTYWAFDVEYFGHYVAKSKAGLARKMIAVKQQVANRLEEIDRLNAAYYRRLNNEMEDLLRTAKEIRAAKKHEPIGVSGPSKKEIICQVRDMLLMGASNLEILRAIPDANPRTISQIRYHLTAKNLL